jgi:CDP-diacylglycerol--serine O-phosphatidyltransferase
MSAEAEKRELNAGEGRAPRKRLGFSRIRRVELGKTLFVLPNLITLASVFCGFNAIRIVALDSPSVDDFHAAAVFLVYAMLFDVLDGRVARLTRTQSAFGVQLDSLADVVSFGLAPALLVYKWALYRYPFAGSLTAFVFVAAGAVRLARFNVLSMNHSARASGKYTMGLPIPPAAGILVALLVLNHALGGALDDERYTVPVFALTLSLSFLMVSTVKFRSFKDLRTSWATFMLVILGIGSSVVVWLLSGKPQMVLVWLPAFYVLIGLVEAVREFALWVFRGLSRHPTSEPPREVP